MLIAVPRGAKAGDRLVLDTSTGARWVVPLPPGATHGTTLTIARPQRAAPDEHIVQVVLATELPLGAVGAVEASPRAAASSAGALAAEGSLGEAFEGDFPAAALPPPPPPNAGAAAASSGFYGQDGEAHVGFPQENVFARAFVAQYLMEQRTSATARSSDAAPGEGSGEAGSPQLPARAVRAARLGRPRRVGREL